VNFAEEFRISGLTPYEAVRRISSPQRTIAAIALPFWLCLRLRLFVDRRTVRERSAH